MTLPVFLSNSSNQLSPANASSLFRQAVSLIFPSALPFAGSPDPLTPSAYSFFLREKEKMIWVEVATVPFTGREVSDYLAKARQIESTCSSEILGILFAPGFEKGIPETMEMIRIPLRLFRYHTGIPLDACARTNQESALWIEELTPSFRPRPAPSPLSSLPPIPRILPPETAPSSRNRLTREELRDFIQLELEMVSCFPPHK